MKNIRKSLVLLLLMMNISSANEGMWEPSQLPNLAKDIRAAGFKGDLNKISNLFEYPLNAIVSLGGCSAAFISDQGLIATNYHCVEGSYLQFNSDRTGKDLFKSGFLAKTIEDEAPSAPGAKVYITQEITNVTTEVLLGTDQSESENHRYKIIQSNKKELIKNCEISPEFQCEVKSFFSGETYQLIKKLAIKDVRLVYAPPQSIGEFGGEIDNWMYPRHTGDFALLRAYVTPENKSQEYRLENIPYKPVSHLKISNKGIQENDFVMVAGYPGTTNRLLTYPEIESDITSGFPIFVEFLKSNIDLMKELTKDDQTKALKYRGNISGYENYYKKISGQIDGAKNFNLLQQEKINWDNLLVFISDNSTKKEQDDLTSLIKITHEIKSENLNERYYGGSALLSTASTIYRHAFEKTKPNHERELGYQERDYDRLVNRLRSLDYRFEASVDKGIFLYRLSRYKEVEKKNRRKIFSSLLHLDEDFSETKSVVNQMYRDSKELLDTDGRIALLNTSWINLISQKTLLSCLLRIFLKKRWKKRSLIKPGQASSKKTNLALLKF